MVRYLRYFFIELKIILFRIPIVLFFGMIFPLIMMVIVVGTSGNPDIGNGYLLSDKYIMIACGIGVVPLALISLPVSIVVEREFGVMERYMLFGMNPLAILWSKVFVHIVIGYLQFFIVCVFAKTVFDLTIPSIPVLLSLSLHLFLVVVFLMLCGMLLGILVKRVQIVQVIGLVFMFSILALCGGFNDFNTLPEGLQKAMGYFPVKYLMNDFLYIWFEEDLFLEKFVILTFAYLIVIMFFIALATRKQFKFNYM